MSLDRDKIWTGDLNRQAVEPQPHVTVGLYDTTLRDGAQGEGLAYSVEDKIKIARALDEIGVTFIEAGWPGANPKDVEFFERAKSLRLNTAVLAASGSTGCLTIFW